MEHKRSLLIAYPVWVALRTYVQIDPSNEVSGFGKLEVTPTGVLRMVDVILPPQTVGPAHIDIGQEQLDQFLVSLVDRGEEPLNWPIWWHSHGHMSTGPSATDENTLAMLAKQHLFNYAIGIVLNANLESTVWAYHNTESYLLGSAVQRVDLALVVEWPLDVAITERCTNEYKAKVSVQPRQGIVRTPHGTTRYLPERPPYKARPVWAEDYNDDFESLFMFDDDFDPATDRTGLWQPFQETH